MMSMAFAQTVFSGTGNWSDISKWSKGVPTIADAATISNGSVCTIDIAASCASLTIKPTSLSTSVTCNTSASITVNAGITINAPTSNRVTGTLNVADGKLTCSFLSLSNPASGIKRVCEFKINNGIADITGVSGITMSGNNTENIIAFTGSGILNVAGALGSGGTINAGTGTINFNGTGSQTIRGYNFYNLISSSTGDRVLQSSVNIGVAGAFSPGINAYTITGSTINFNGTGDQIVPGFQYNNLIVSGTRKGSFITLITSDTIFVQGNFTNNATFTTGAYVSTNNVFVFNGGVQSIGTLTFNQLIIAGTGSRRQKTLAGAVNVNSDLIIGAGDTLNLSAQNTNVYGETIVDGTLTDNNTGGVNTLYGHLTVNGVWNITSAESFTFTGGITNNGYFSSSTGVYTFATNAQLIDGTGTINSNGSIAINNGITITNNATLNVRGNITGSTGCTFINNPGAALAVGGALLSTGTLNASADNNTVTYNNAATQTIKTTAYYNLVKQSTGALNITSAITVNGNLSIDAGTVNINGVSGSITGSATGYMTMNAGTVLNLGLISQATSNDFPSVFTTANISLNATSTVNYNANTSSQIIRGITYGNMGILTGNANVTKLFSGNTTINGNLAITNGSGKLSVAANTNDLIIKGNLSGNGNLTLTTGDFNLGGNSNLFTGALTFGSGTITCDGTSAQSVCGGSMNNLTINNAAGVTLTTQTKVSSTLTLSNGILYTGDALILLSNANQSARIAPITAGSISGKVTVHRFVTGGADRRQWRFLASPVENVSLINSWQDSIHITGIGTGGTACPSPTRNSNGFDVTQTNSPSVYTFNEVNNSWDAIANTTATNLTTGTGYRVFIRGSRKDGCNILANTVYNTSDVTLVTKGNIIVGDKTVSVTNTKTSGWNLLGNPYASAIDWGNDAWQAAMDPKISRTIYIWNPATNSYSSWNPVAGGINNGSNIIASGQAFFVCVSNSTSLTFKESYKSPDQSTSIFGKSSRQNNLKLQLFDTAVLDEAIVYSVTGATNSFDKLYDGYKLDNNTNKISSFTTTDSTKLSINSFFVSGSYRAIDTIPISINFGTAYRTLKIKFSGISSFTRNVWLFDKFTSSIIDLSFSNEYTFTTNSNPLSRNQFRFYLMFADRSNSSLPVEITSFSASKSNGGVLLNWETSSEINSSHFVIERSTDANDFNEIGVVMASVNSKTTNNYSFIDAKPSSKNYYRLKLVDADGKFAYTNIISVLFDNTNDLEIMVYPNPSTSDFNVKLITGSTLPVNIKLFDMSGRLVMELKKEHPEEGIVISNIPYAGIYTADIIQGDYHKIMKITKME